MKAIEITFALLLLAASIWGLTRMLGTRRRLRRAVVVECAVTPGEVVAPELARAGLTEPIRHGRFSGARGTIDGVQVQALSVVERSPTSAQVVWTLGVLGPPGRRRLQLSAGPRGMRMDKRALSLGIARVDEALDVRGDRADAFALFGRDAHDALVSAITVHGWRLAEGELACGACTASSDLAAIARAGAAAGRVLHVPRRRPPSPTPRSPARASDRATADHAAGQRPSP